MPIVIAVLGILSAGLGILLASINTSASNAAASINRRQAFYACDGIARGVINLSHTYLKSTTTPTSGGLRSAVCTASGPDDCTTGVLPNLAPAGYTVESFTTTLVGARAPGTVPSGPFAGMNASIDEFKVSITAKKNSTDARCSVEQVVSSADISLFQFFAWADGFLDIYPAPVMSVSGRVHVNGDFCAGSFSNRLSIDILTASSHVYSGTNCPRFNQASGNYFVGDAGGDGVASTHPVSSTTDAVRGDWVTFAPTNWGGKLNDSSHGVTPLKFPITGQPRVQDGYRAPANATSLISNNSSSIRFILDPPTTSDDRSIKEQRYACKADIRIINGVWYKRPPNPSDGCGFPGIPIWSDHPGHYTVSESVEGGNAGGSDTMFVSAVNAGQEDLATGWSGTIPRKYSYYEYDATNKLVFANTTGVVSYGTLIKNGSGTSSTWKPGIWNKIQAGAPSANGYGTSSTGTFDDAHFCSAGAASAAAGGAIADATTVTCTTGATVNDRGSVLLGATRSGFRDTRAMNVDDAADEMLPLNFDVAAFADAMATNSGNELGSHFSAGSTFNGIVYIGLTWPNSRLGMGNNGGTTLATLWPRNGADLQRDVNQPPTSYPLATTTQQRALPYPLCSQTVAGATPPSADAPASRIPFSGGTAAASFFSIPPCSNTANVNTARPNSVRIHNARSLTTGTFVFPKGLAIVSNAPVYLLGDFNAGSATLANWRPAMVGGDAITFLSNDWQDTNSPWADGAGTAIGARVPSSTTYFVAAIAGDVQTSTNGSCTGNCWSGGLNNFPRFMEKWSNTGGGGAPEFTAKINGSFVIGFRSVYARQPWNLDTGDTSYHPPIRDWDFDTQFNLPTNQPPGAPNFSIDGVRTWRRE